VRPSSRHCEQRYSIWLEAIDIQAKPGRDDDLSFSDPSRFACAVTMSKEFWQFLQISQSVNVNNNQLKGLYFVQTGDNFRDPFKRFE